MDFKDIKYMEGRNYFLNVADNLNLLHKDPSIYRNINLAATEIADCFKKVGNSS